MRNAVIGHKIDVAPVLESSRLKRQGPSSGCNDALRKILRSSQPDRNVRLPIEHLTIVPFVRDEVLARADVLAAELAGKDNGAVQQGKNRRMTRQLLGVQLHRK